MFVIMAERTTITPTAAGLRALSHPTRLKILKRLRLQGPATATVLAGELGLNTGATSYHLRQLADHGFVEEDTDRGDARDRWWKAAHQSTRANLDEQRSEEEADTAEAYLRTVALMYTETLMQYAAEHRFLPQPWKDASTTSDWNLRLTPPQARELVDTLASLIDSWADRETVADDAEMFMVNLNAFPQPGTVPAAGLAEDGDR
jgi:DNA-binding transcriptional ArsR family regulator